MSCGTKTGLVRNPAPGAARASMIGYAPLPFFAKNLLIFAFMGSRTRRWLSLHGCGSGRENRAQRVDKKSLTADGHASCAPLDAQEGTMSFHVVRHERATIFVLNRQTYETYRFTIGHDVAVAHVGPPSDLSTARRAAIAFLAQSEKGARPPPTQFPD
jgi:hypothetical protein